MDFLIQISQIFQQSADYLIAAWIVGWIAWIADQIAGWIVGWIAWIVDWIAWIADQIVDWIVQKTEMFELQQMNLFLDKMYVPHIL